MLDMKNLIITILMFSLEYSSTFIYPQQTLKPIVVSPLIGEKLDRVEEDYFNLFPVITDFQEATFYLNSDSTLLVNIKGNHRSTFIDTTLACNISISDLKDKLDQILLDDIENNRVQKLELSTKDNKIFEGTVYSINNDKINLVKKDFDYINSMNSKDEYFQVLDYSHLNTVTVNENNDGITILSVIAGMVVGCLLGVAIAPEPTLWEPKTYSWGLLVADAPYMDNSKTYIFGILGLCIGGVTGYFIGNSIKIPIEYDILDPKAKKIIYDNSLLPSGL